MKTATLIIVSSLFFSSFSVEKNKDYVEKIITHKVDKTEKIKVENKINYRTPIIILKRD